MPKVKKVVVKSKKGAPKKKANPFGVKTKNPKKVTAPIKMKDFTKTSMKKPFGKNNFEIADFNKLSQELAREEIAEAELKERTPQPPRPKKPALQLYINMVTEEEFDEVTQLVSQL